MKYFKYKKLASVLIVLVSSIILFTLVVMFSFLTFSIGGSTHKKEFAFTMDTSGNKYLTKYIWNEGKSQIYDLKEKLLRVEKDGANRDNDVAYLKWEFFSQEQYRLPSKMHSSCVRIARHSKDVWHYLPKPKYFICYDSSTCRVIGYFGKNGFSKNLKNINKFEQVVFFYEFDDNVFIIDGSDLFLVNLVNSEVRLILNGVKGDIRSINGVYYQRTNMSLPPILKHFIISLNNKISTYDLNGDLVHSVELPSDMLEVSYFTYSYTGKHYIQYDVGSVRDGFSSIVRELSDDGKVLWQYNYNQIAPNENLTMLEFHLLAIPFSGRVIIRIHSFFIPNNNQIKGEKTVSESPLEEIGDVNVLFIISFIILILCLVFVYRHLIKRTDSNVCLYGWLLLILMFSLPAILAYLICYRHIKTITCLTCNKAFAPIDEVCLFCKKEISAPALDGKEVFNIH